MHYFSITFQPGACFVASMLVLETRPWLRVSGIAPADSHIYTHMVSAGVYVSIFFAAIKVKLNNANIPCMLYML